MKKTLLAALAVLVVAVLGFGAAAEKPKQSKQTEDKTFFDRLKESSPLHYQLVGRKYDEVLKTLPYIEDISAIEPVTGGTALTVAAHDDTSDAYDMVKVLILKFGSDPNETDHNGYTALHFAAKTGNLPVVEFLVNQGADLNAAPKRRCRDCAPKTPLYMAYQRGHNRVVEFLESQGADRIDPETKETLDIQAKISEALDGFRGQRPPRGVDPKAWRRSKLNNVFDAGTEVLRSSGYVEMADRINQSRGPMLQAIEDTPRPAGMSYSDWKRLVLANMNANLKTINQ